MAAVAQRLVGRADEIGVIEAALAELAHGRSATVELVGEPGIGKSRLLAELAVRADALGFLVLGGRAAELERDLPFWVFVDSLEEYVEGLKPEQVDALDEDVLTELATVLPSLSARTAGRQVALQHERYRSHRAVRELLELLAADQPLALVLDDLHWADPASLELVGALLRRPPAGPVLMALAVRPRQAPDRLSAALERAHRVGTVTRLQLGALARAEADELLGDAITAGDAALLYEESGGNPFYLEQLARTLDRAGGTTAAPAIRIEGVTVPPTVAAALAEELSLLSEESRRVLAGAAVAGDPFDPDLAAAAAAASEATTLDALDQLLRLDLVRPTDVPRRFRFRHPLVRRAVYEGAPGGWLLGAHERSADALSARGAPASACAHHVERAARQGDDAAIAVLREAGEAAVRRAPASAERWFGAALRLLPENATADERVELLLGQSGALAATGRFSESHSTLIESLALVPDHVSGLRVRLTTACAAVELQIGQNRRAMDRLRDALAGVGDPAGSEAVELLHALAVNGLFGSDYDAMLDWAARAVDAARPLGDPALMAATLAVRAAGAALSGRVATARAYRDEAAELIDALPDDELARRLEAPSHLALAELYLDHFDAAGRHAERALRVGRSSAQGDLFPMILVVLGSALWIQGAVAEGCAVLEGAVEGSRLLDGRHAIGWHLFNHSYAALAAGDVDLALVTARESVELVSDLGEGPITAHAAAALAAASLETGDAQRAAELLLTGAGGPEMRLIGGGWRARYLEMQTRALLGCGRTEEAERAAAAARECADLTGLPMAGAMAGRAAAALAMDSGDPAASAALNLAAADALEGVGDLFDAAGSRILAGRALAQAGDEDAAAAQLERAASSFESFGALRYRDEAERELRKLGRRIHRRTRPGTGGAVGVESLTERELGVARLIVDRRTNTEIAAALFLSRKTVEAHIRNMFVKLGVSSRAEIARAVERADLQESSS